MSQKAAHKSSTEVLSKLPFHFLPERESSAHAQHAGNVGVCSSTSTRYKPKTQCSLYMCKLNRGAARRSPGGASSTVFLTSSARCKRSRVQSAPSGPAGMDIDLQDLLALCLYRCMLQRLRHATARVTGDRRARAPRCASFPPTTLRLPERRCPFYSFARSAFAFTSLFCFVFDSYPRAPDFPATPACFFGQAAPWGPRCRSC